MCLPAHTYVVCFRRIPGTRPSVWGKCYVSAVFLTCPCSRVAQKGSLASPGFMCSVFLGYINSRFVLSSVRRQVIVMWLASLTDAATTAGHSVRQAADVVKLFQGASESDLDVGIAALVPNTRQIAHMVHIIYSTLIFPTLEDHQRLAQQTAGLVVPSELVWCP